MFVDIIEIVLGSAASAFIEVGVFVGAVLLFFGYINFRQAGAFVERIEKSKRWQPLIGALLGLTPGCGGAIFVMPLFFKGSVTFGTVVATLVATMGDSSFVLIASRPRQYLLISALSLVVGVATGYLVDLTDLGPRLLQSYRARQAARTQDRALHLAREHAAGNMKDFHHLGHEEGDAIDLALHHGKYGHRDEDCLPCRITHGGFWVLWVFIALGLVLGVMDLMQIDINALAIPNLGTIVGASGTALAIVFMALARKFLGSDTHEETEEKVMSLRETFIHNAQETAFVITWVFVGFLFYELLVFGLGGGDYAAGTALVESLLLTVGIASVFVGALVGMIPGCGPQILFVALYGRGIIPFAALFANAVSQDGDALFPLLALDKRSAMFASVITIIPALLFGLLIYWAEINTVLGKLFNY